MGKLLSVLDRFGWACINQITPGLTNAQHRYARDLEAAVRPGTRWLDIGCGHRLLPSWLHGAEARQWAMARRAGLAVGIDLDEGSLGKNRLLAGRVAKTDVTRLPFADGSFDVVTANMVFEHLADPAAALREVRRVLRPSGELLLMTPNAAHPFVWLVGWLPQRAKHALARVLEGRAAGDVFETFYRFNRIDAVRAVAAEVGMDPAAVDAVETSPVMHRMGPLAAAELLLTRALRARRLARYRSVLIVRLRRERPAAIVTATAAAA